MTRKRFHTLATMSPDVGAVRRVFHKIFQFLLIVDRSPKVAAMKIKQLDVISYRAQVSQTVVMSFSSLPSRAMALMRIESTDGDVGWGEIWGNFPAITIEHRARLAGWALPNVLIGAELDLADIGGFCDGLREKLHVLAVQSDEPGPVASIICAVSQALWDLAARKADVPLRHLLNPDARDTVPAYASGLNPTDCLENLPRCQAEGYRAYKLKVGFPGGTDERNIAGLFDLMQAGERLFVDANQRWTLEEAVAAADALAQFPIGWLEEPILVDRPASEWQTLKAECAIPLAGGENLRAFPDFSAALAWLDFMQPDIGKWGGIEASWKIARETLAAGHTYCPHWLAGGIGLLHSAQLLAAAGGGGLLEVDSNENPLRTAFTDLVPGIADGDFHIGEGPGFGAEVPLDRLSAWQTGHETFD